MLLGCAYIAVCDPGEGVCHKFFESFDVSSLSHDRAPSLQPSKKATKNITPFAVSWVLLADFSAPAPPAVVGGLLPPRSYGEWWQQARAGAAPVEVRGEAEDAGEWDWDALDVCTDANAISIIPATASSWLSLRPFHAAHLVRAASTMTNHREAKLAAAITIVCACISAGRMLNDRFAARQGGIQGPLHDQLQQAATEVQQAEAWRNQLVSHATAHGIRLPGMDTVSLHCEFIQPAACDSQAAALPHEASVPRPRLKSGMPSLLTPNASQHPDTDEIVYLLQHLGPWCDAGRSYPEAMGGLRALGGALRRRYSRGVAQVLLQYECIQYTKWSR